MSITGWFPGQTPDAFSKYSEMPKHPDVVIVDHMLKKSINKAAFVAVGMIRETCAALPLEAI